MLDLALLMALFIADQLAPVNNYLRQKRRFIWRWVSRRTTGPAMNAQNDLQKVQANPAIAETLRIQAELRVEEELLAAEQRGRELLKERLRNAHVPVPARRERSNSSRVRDVRFVDEAVAI